MNTLIYINKGDMIVSITFDNITNQFILLLQLFHLCWVIESEHICFTQQYNSTFNYYIISISVTLHHQSMMLYNVYVLYYL